GSQFARLGEQRLISGMPAEIFIQTGSRTMMSYLFKPITHQLRRMFRERWTARETAPHPLLRFARCERLGVARSGLILRRKSLNLQPVPSGFWLRRHPRRIVLTTNYGPDLRADRIQRNFKRRWQNSACGRAAKPKPPSKNARL